MHRPLFEQINHKVATMNPYFLCKPDALGVMGFHPFHKCVIATKMLGHASIADDMDDEYAMGESTILDCVNEFTSTIVDLYEANYLQPPNAKEVQCILAENEARGFPGMLRSIDCMH
jgi:hypothetical protein